MELYFSPAAQIELDEAFAFLEGEQSGLGYRFTADVDEALGRIRIGISDLTLATRRTACIIASVMPPVARHVHPA